MRVPLLLLCVCCLCAFTGDTRQLRVTVTAYCDGQVTAAGTRPRVGILALSRDVERALGVTFGDKVTLEGIGRFVFLDRMPWYWQRRVDVYMVPRGRALAFGKRRALLRRAP